MIVADRVPASSVSSWLGTRLKVTCVPEEPLGGETVSHSCEDAAVQPKATPVDPTLTFWLSADAREVVSITKLGEAGVNVKDDVATMYVTPIDTVWAAVVRVRVAVWVPGTRLVVFTPTLIVTGAVPLAGALSHPVAPAP